MSHFLFCRIQNAVEAHDTYFVQRRDGFKRLSSFIPFRILQTYLRCLHMVLLLILWTNT
jgi:hypothetical protein